MDGKIESQYRSLVLCTKLSKKEQKKLIYWFARQNISLQISIFREQKRYFFNFRDKKVKEEVIPISSFLLSILHFYTLKNIKKRKNRQKDLDESKKISNFLLMQSRKERYKVKKEKLLNIWSVVSNLRSEDFSYRKISSYLKGHHKLNISHTYISLIFKELEGES